MDYMSINFVTMAVFESVFVSIFVVSTYGSIRINDIEKITKNAPQKFKLCHKSCSYMYI